MKWLAKTFLVLLLIPVAALAHQQSQTADVPPGPTTVYRMSTPVTNPEGYNLVTLVLEFAPGAWTPVHVHGGEGLITVLDGELTLRIEGEDEQTFGPGEGWHEPEGRRHSAGNNTDAPARLVVTFIAAEGAELTTVQE